MKKLLLIIAGIFLYSNLASADFMMCTMQYDPVCGSVSTTDDNGDTYNIYKTFGNSCTLESNGNATYLSAGECSNEGEKVIGVMDSVDTSEDEEETQICTMEYSPVCGKDGTTYSNSCMAGNIETSYEGICMQSSTQYNLKVKLDTLTDSLDSSGKNTKLIYTNTINKITNLTSSNSLSYEKLGMINYVKNYLQNYVNGN